MFKLGNSKGIYIPKDVYTNLVENEEYEWEVYTKDVYTGEDVYTKEKVITMERDESVPVITEQKRIFNTDMCSKHKGSRKGTCGCK